MPKKVTIKVDDETNRRMDETGVVKAQLMERGIQLALAEFYQDEPRGPQPLWLALRERFGAPVEAPRIVAEPAKVADVPVIVSEPARVADEPVVVPAKAYHEPKFDPTPTREPGLEPEPEFDDTNVRWVKGVKWLDAAWACSQLGVDYENLRLSLDEEDIVVVEGAESVDSLGFATLMGLAQDTDTDPEKVRAFEKWFESLKL